MQKKRMLPPLLTAVVTPFRKDLQIDREAFVRLLSRQIAVGAGLVVCGTTGESSSLSDQEKRELFTVAVETAAGRVPVIAGCGSNDTAHAVALTQMAEECGADGALLVTPYYCKPSEEGIFRHYVAIHEASRLPLLVYHVPGRTGVRISPGLLRRLAELSRVVAIKDADPDLAAVAARMAACDGGIDFFCGNDELALPALAMGEAGLISVTSNLFPEEVMALCLAALAGEREQALALHRRLLPVTTALFAEGNPVPVKYALSLSGLCLPACRLPLCPPSKATESAVRAALAGMEDLSE